MATVKIYVGRLSYDTTEKTLTELFTKYGDVASVALIIDRDSNRSKGFAFIEMKEIKAAQAAIDELNDSTLDGRSIIVNAAKERDQKPRERSGPRRSW